MSKKCEVCDPLKFPVGCSVCAYNPNFENKKRDFLTPNFKEIVMPETNLSN